MGLLGAALSGCASLGYYAQLARGQMELLNKREPIAKIVEDPRRDAELRRRLALVLDARRFAVDRLDLPDNGSYTLYADLGRPFVLWNVFAAPEFSLAAVESCFPLAGCVAYRGHYRKELAQAAADKLKKEGYDVEIGGVPAYSTLGWFDDPVLSTMMRWSDAVLVGTVFHELGHLRFYVKNQTTFNESYANFIEEQGLHEYFAAGHINAEDSATQRQREARFVALVIATRQKLSVLYSLPLSPEAMRAQKAEAFARLKADYARLRDTEWHGERDYEGWFARELNNASLLPVGLYDEWMPAFRMLFEECGHDWPRFHTAVAKLGGLGAEARQQRLSELQAAAAVLASP